MRIIDADALINAIFDHCRSESEIKNHFFYDENIISIIYNAPTLEQPEHITAEWNIIKSKAMQFDEYVCNRCNTYALEIMGKSYASRYCPYCGAYMKGSDNE